MKLIVSKPSAVKKDPGVVFPFTSQYLNVLFIPTNIEELFNGSILNPASALNINLLMFA